MATELDMEVSRILEHVNWAKVGKKLKAIGVSRFTEEIHIRGWLVSLQFRIKTLSRILGVTLPTKFWHQHTNMTVKLGESGFQCMFESGQWMGGISPYMFRVSKVYDLDVRKLWGTKLQLADTYTEEFREKTFPDYCNSAVLCVTDPYFHFDWSDQYSHSFFHRPEVRLQSRHHNYGFIYDEILFNDQTLAVETSSATVAARRFLSTYC